MVFSNHSQSFLVTSETNHGYRLPWKRICFARPVWIKKSADIQRSRLIQTSRRQDEPTIDAVTVKLEAGIVQDKIDSTAGLFAEFSDSHPELVKVISENVL